MNDNSDIETITDTSEGTPKTTIEERIENIEKLVQKLIKSENVNKNHVKNRFTKNPKQKQKVFHNTSYDQKPKECWICHKLGHLSYNCRYNYRNQRNGFHKNHSKNNQKNGHQSTHSFLLQPNAQQTGPPLLTYVIPASQQSYQAYQQNYPPIDRQYQEFHQTNRQIVRN